MQGHRMRTHPQANLLHRWLEFIVLENAKKRCRKSGHDREMTMTGSSGSGSDASEVSGVNEASEVSEVSEVSVASEVSDDSEVSEASEVIEASEVSEAIELSEVSESKMSAASQR